MSDSPSQDPGDGAVSPHASQQAVFDVENRLPVLVRPESGIAGLAKALKDQRLRDVLKQHGIKIQADDDVGYNSLPLELRDHIRSFAIADAHPEHLKIRCRCCPRLAPYACIDSEWRDAVELVTFRRLCFTETSQRLTKNLELLERYVVGSRQKYVQHISLCVKTALFPRADGEIDELLEQNLVNTLTSPIRQLLNCVAQWHECSTGDGNLRVKILEDGQAIWGPNQVAQVFPRRVHTGLTNLPTAPQIVHFGISLGGHTGTRSMLALLSCMPHIRTLSVLLKPDLHEEDQDHDSQMQLLYNSLSQTAPNLEGLDIECYRIRGIGNELQVMFCNASFSFSQRLRKLSFGRLTLPMVRAILAPFSTASFKPCSPPPLAWPELTHFTMGKLYFTEAEDQICMVINELMLTVGRVIRYMPRIQYLNIGMSYSHRTEQNNGLITQINRSTKIAFDLQSSRQSHYHIPVAELHVTHYTDSKLPEAVPSGEVVKLWDKSVSCMANTRLELQVVSQPYGESQLREFGA